MWVEASFVREVANRLRGKGCPVDQLLRRHSISTAALNSDESVGVAVLAELLEYGAEWLADPHFGLTCARDMRIRTLGNLVGYLGLCSETVLEALRNIQRYVATYADHLTLRLSIAKDGTEIAIQVHELEWAAHPQLTEFMVGRLVAALRELTGELVRPLRVAFVHQRPQPDKVCERFFGCTVAFGEPKDLVVLPPAVLDKSIASSDPNLLVLLRRYSDLLVKSKRKSRELPLPDRVRLAVARLLPSGRAGTRDIAAELGLSERSLRRHLQADGISLHELLEEVRRSHALSWLKNRTIPAKQAASLLGYSDVSAFSRAFKRWTGHTPGKSPSTRGAEDQADHGEGWLMGFRFRSSIRGAAQFVRT